MKLPAPIHRYFEADRGDDANHLAAAFAPDARVHDDGETRIGPADIAVWWRAAKDKYQATTQPIQVETKGNVTTVRATVSGNFPGSPATLTYVFQIDADRIARLEISG